MNGIDWEAHFGSSPDKWTDEQFKMAMFSTVSGQNITLTQLQKTVNSLPCSKHSDEIETLIEFKKSCNGTSQAKQVETVKGSINLRNALIIALVSLGSTLITIIISFILTGKP